VDKIAINTKSNLLDDMQEGILEMPMTYGTVQTMALAHQQICAREDPWLIFFASTKTFGG
jgi:hypothetical protein